MTQDTQTRKPDMNVFVSIPGEDKDRIGAQIGVAFKHKDSEGFTVILDAQPIPVNGRVKLVAFPPSEK